MEQFFIDFEERLDAMHADLHNILDQLPDEALDWQPGPDMNSIAILITHLTGAERYWIGDMAISESSNRVRSTEFEVRNVTAADLKDRLHKSMRYSHSALQKLSVADLALSKKSSQHDHSFSVAWCLLHALEHTAVHTGHVQIIGQLWQQQN